MRLAWLPLIALCAATAARADEPTRLVAHFTRADPATVTDGQGFALPRGAVREIVTRQPALPGPGQAEAA